MTVIVERDLQCVCGWMEPATEYQVTDTGKEFLVANGANTPAGQAAFCSGKYTVMDNDGWSTSACSGSDKQPLSVLKRKAFHQ